MATIQPPSFLQTTGTFGKKYDECALVNKISPSIFYEAPDIAEVPYC